MKKELKQITDLTLNELLNNEIILPSMYFESFTHNAKEANIDINDKEFNSGINKILSEELNAITYYTKNLLSNISDLKTNVQDASDAVKNGDKQSLDGIYDKIRNIEMQVNKLNDNILLDDITNTYNKKWIYTQFLDEKSEFKNSGIAVLIDVIDFDYIKNEYGDLIANNLMLFVAKFLKKHLSKHGFEYELAKFSMNKFLLFAFNEDKENINNIILHIKDLLTDTTLKSKSGLYIKANYSFCIEKYSEHQNSKDIIEKLFVKKC